MHCPDVPGLARQVACPSVFLAQSQLREFLSTEAALEASTAANDRPQRSSRVLADWRERELLPVMQQGRAHPTT